MSFANPAPPATPKQVQYLLSLVQKAGHRDFRDARRALGLTQRQASGKFTRREASALIDQLLGNPPADDGEGDVAGPGPGQLRLGAPSGEALAASERLLAEQAALVRGVPAEVLATELERRGWHVARPG